MADRQAKKRKAKAYYIQSAKQQKRACYKLDSGQKGFLCTCNNREKECVREAYNLLNEYADKLYGPENKAEVRDKEKQDGEEEEDIAEALAKEVNSFKEQASTRAERRFKSVDSGANNCIFIKTTLENPTEVVDSVLKDIQTTGQQKSRFLIRLLPIEATCKANIDDIKRSVEPILERHFQNVKTFSVLFRVRNNNQMKRDDVIAAVAQMITKRFPDIRPNLNDPEKSITIEIIQTYACIGVVSRYFDFAKYNLVELAQKGKPKSITASETQNAEVASETTPSDEKETEVIETAPENVTETLAGLDKSEEAKGQDVAT